MIRLLGTVVIIAVAFAVFFVGTETFSLQDSTFGNTILGGVAALAVVALFKIWKR